MLATLVGCVLLSLAVGVWTGATSGPDGALAFLRVVVVGQAVVLTVGGGLACLQAIRRDGAARTFDHERITRLSALDLTLGKLFGPPLLAYFAALCLVPAAIAGALMSGAGVSTLLGTWILIGFGTVAVQALALLLSMRSGGGAGPAAVLLLCAAATLAIPAALRVGPLNPIALGALVGQQQAPVVFFGLSIPHGIAAVLIQAGAAMWILVPVVRNLKQDPAIHELLSPLQALGLLLTVHVALLGFSDWSAPSALRSHRDALTFGAVAAWMLGLAMLHSPEVARRRARRLVEPTGWLEAVWPSTPLVAGVAIAGLTGVVVAAFRATDGTGWSPWMGAFTVAYLGLWVARDLICLQWVRLTKLPRPFLSGVLALLGFYGLMSALLHVLAAPDYVSAMLAPMAVGKLAARGWAWLWLLPLFVQAASVAAFAFLRFRQLTAIGESVER